MTADSKKPRRRASHEQREFVDASLALIRVAVDGAWTDDALFAAAERVDAAVAKLVDATRDARSEQRGA